MKADQIVITVSVEVKPNFSLWQALKTRILGKEAINRIVDEICQGIRETKE